MAKYAQSVAVGFHTQTAEGTMDTGLDAITTPFADTDGLVLGTSTGLRDSGLTFAWGRSKREKAPISGTFSRSLADFLRAEVRTFDFSAPFCGNRATASGTPADSEFDPIVGLQALLTGLGMQGSNWGSGVGRVWGFSSAAAASIPISSLLYASGMRIEMKDCRVAKAVFQFTAGDIPVLTSSLSVGSLNSTPTEAAIPATITYGVQASQSAPRIVGIGNDWGPTRGFESLTITVDNKIDEVPDSNATDGFFYDPADREVKIEATIFKDDSDENMEYTQMILESAGSLEALTFTVGTAATAGSVIKAFSVSIPYPEVDEESFETLGSKAAGKVALIARGSVGNDELTFTFK